MAERSRYCLHCAEWHRGDCPTVRETDPRLLVGPRNDMARDPRDRFPTRAPEGPFRVGGRKHR